MSQEKRFKIDPAAAKTVLDAFIAFFQRGYSEILPTDVGTWTLAMKNAEGETYRFTGTLTADDFSRHRLSDLVREKLESYTFAQIVSKA